MTAKKKKPPKISNDDLTNMMAQAASALLNGGDQKIMSSNLIPTYTVDEIGAIEKIVNNRLELKQNLSLQSEISSKTNLEYINGEKILVTNNVEIPSLKKEKIGDKAFSQICNIHDILNERKNIGELTQKQFEDSIKKQGLKKIQRRHKKRETNPNLSGDVISRGMTITEMCNKMNLSTIYVTPLLILMQKYGHCDTFQVLDRDEKLNKLYEGRRILEKSKRLSKKEKASLNKIRREIPTEEKKCSVYVLANEKTMDFSELMSGTHSFDPEKYEIHPAAILEELR